MAELRRVIVPSAVPSTERAQVTRAQTHLQAADEALAAIATLDPVTASNIAEVQAVSDALQSAAYALAVEPPARALSQLAYHRGTESLVLFGGDGLDRHFADTWVYDCATRTWQQRYPSRSPSPRAGHALIALPASDKILLIGGYRLGNGHSYMYRDTYRSGAAQAWVYDPPQDSWAFISRCRATRCRRGAGHSLSWPRPMVTTS